MSAPIVLGHGYLVVLKTEVTGGYTNERFPLGEEPEGEHGLLKKWRTEKHVTHVEALAAAEKCRSEARNTVVKACRSTPFSLFLPEADEAKFEAALAAANSMISAHNAKALEDGTPVKVALFALRGRIGGESSRAAELASIKSCAADLLAQLGAAVAAGDVTTLRDVANQARSLAPMLEDGSEGRTKLDRAVKQARAVAKAILQRVEQQGELLADVLAQSQTSAIAEARFAFEVVSVDEEDEEGDISGVDPDEEAPDSADVDAVIALAGDEPADDILLPGLAEGDGPPPWVDPEASEEAEDDEEDDDEIDFTTDPAAVIGVAGEEIDDEELGF